MTGIDSDAGQLPITPVEDGSIGTGLEPADPRYVAILRAGLLPIAAILLAVGVGAAIGLRSADLPVWSVPPILTTLVAVWLLFVWPPQRVAAMAHGLDDRMLRTVHGVQFHVDTIVPLRRIQHLDVAQGPLERTRGLARLIVHTAGDSDSTVTLAGLPRPRAEAMRDAIRAAILAERGDADADAVMEARAPEPRPAP